MLIQSNAVGRVTFVGNSGTSPVRVWILRSAQNDRTRGFSVVRKITGVGFRRLETVAAQDSLQALALALGCIEWWLLSHAKIRGGEILVYGVGTRRSWLIRPRLR